MRTWDQTIVKLETYKSLLRNWDSYGAEPPCHDCIDGAISLAKMFRNRGDLIVPLVVPSSKGTIYFEYRDPPYREIEIVSRHRAEDRNTDDLGATIINIE